MHGIGNGGARLRGAVGLAPRLAWRRGGGWGGAVAAGVIGGAVAAATSPLWAPGYYDYDPGYAYGPAYAVAPAPVIGGGGGVAYCESRFRSYNPATGMYLGYDGAVPPLSIGSGQHPAPFAGATEIF